MKFVLIKNQFVDHGFVSSTVYHLPPTNTYNRSTGAQAPIITINHNTQ